MQRYAVLMARRRPVVGGGDAPGRDPGTATGGGRGERPPPTSPPRSEALDETGELLPGGEDAAGGAAGTVSEAGGAFRRDPAGRWYRVVDGAPVASAGDLTLGDLFDPPAGEVDGEVVRLVPRTWASRHPDHPLAWIFEHADLGGRGPIPVPNQAWAERADAVVAMAAPTLHPWKLIGPDGVAALLGVAEATVRAYLARGQMPDPLVRIGRTPVWSIDQIEAWQTTRARARPPSFTPRPAPGPVEADEGAPHPTEPEPEPEPGTGPRSPMRPWPPGRTV